MFKGRKLLIATKHKKETVIAPLFEEALQLQQVSTSTFDTDQLGTFSGEIERTVSPLAAAKAKCLKALEQEPSFDLVIASEGSFGPHPHIPFLPANEEILLLYDQKNKLEIWANSLSTNTNFASKPISSEEELSTYANQIQFPGHGLILKISQAKQPLIIKDIDSFTELIQVYRRYHTKEAAIIAETDMRAMRNPTRMKHIQSTAQKLLNKVKSSCPNCQWPGFSVKRIISGLPCQACLSPTRSPLLYWYCCEKCDFASSVHFPQGKQYEDPGHCDRCNP